MSSCKVTGLTAECYTNLKAILPYPLRAFKLTWGSTACDGVKQIQPQLGSLREVSHTKQSSFVHSCHQSVGMKLSFKSTGLIQHVLTYLLFNFNHCKQYSAIFFFFLQLMTTCVYISWSRTFSGILKLGRWINGRHKVMRSSSISLLERAPDLPLRW